jgi:hypothetical protein
VAFEWEEGIREEWGQREHRCSVQRIEQSWSLRLQQSDCSVNTVSLAVYERAEY